MMQTLKIKILGIVVIAGLFATACSDNSTNPDATKVNLEMKAVTQVGSINPGGRIAATDITFTEAMVGVTKIEFESSSDESDNDHSGNGMNNDDNSGNSGDDDSGEQEMEIKGNFIVDLLAGTSNPDFGISGITPGVYDKLEIKMRPILADGNTLKVVFDYSVDGSDPVQVEISTKQELEFEIESNSVLDLSGVSTSDILVLFDLDQLLAGINFSGASVDGDGVIRINETSNTAIANSIFSSIHSAFEAGEDHNHDDKFDDSNDD